MFAKIITYNSQNYVGILGTGLLTKLGITLDFFTNQTVLKYFEQRLIPAFKEHSSVEK